MPNWTKKDSQAARKQGWDIFDIYEERVMSEVQKFDESDIFKTDEAARQHVRGHTLTDPLCAKAVLLVFESKLRGGKK